MSSSDAAPIGADPTRHVNHALAALREAAECLEEAAAASEHPSLGVASALSHVAAARSALRPHGFGEGRDALERDAA